MSRHWSRSSRKVVDSLFLQNILLAMLSGLSYIHTLHLANVYSLLFVIMVNLQDDKYVIEDNTSSKAYIVVG